VGDEIERNPTFVEWVLVLLEERFPWLGSGRDEPAGGADTVDELAERDKVRCRSCELVQWSDRANCRRCGTSLPEPTVRIVERVVEKVVIRQDPQCLQKLEEASRLISTATERLTLQCVESVAPIVLAQVPESGVFPTMAEMERAIILAAYERSNRRPLEAARLLGIGKTTVYRKLRAMGEAAA
jgi:hypothetical protein